MTCWGDVLYMDQGQATSPEDFQSRGLGQYHSCGVRTTGDIPLLGFDGWESGTTVDETTAIRRTETDI